MNSIMKYKRVDPTGVRVEVYVGENIRELVKKYKIKVHDEDLPDPQAMAQTFNYKSKSTNKESLGMETTRFAILLKPNASTDTIAHESTHLASMIYAWAGAGVNVEDDEIYAYHIGWVAKLCTEALSMYSKKFSVKTVSVDP